MLPGQMLDSLPLWTVFVVTVLVVLLSLTAGFHLGLRKRRKSAGGGESSIGSVVGAMLGLLAFFLAFTFGAAATRFDQRKQILLNEVNAIGTGVLRADLIPEPQRSECRQLFREYVDLRLDAIRHPERLSRAIAESEAIQDRLWSRAVALAQAHPDSHVIPLFIQALNDLFDLHTSRITVALQYRIPPGVWGALMFITALSMGAVGYQFGLADRSEILLRLTLALAFSSVVFIIADLDRPGGGALRVSQQPMLDLQKRLGAITTPAPPP